MTFQRVFLCNLFVDLQILSVFILKVKWKKIRGIFDILMLFYFRKGKNAAQTAKKICIVYGDSAVAESTVRKWFTRFRNDNFDLENRERSSRLAVIDDDQILTLIENNPRHTTRNIAEILYISHMSVIRYLKIFRYINRYDVWVPHKLTEKNLIDRILCSNATKIHF